MSLSSALGTALSGMRASQTGIGIVSQNVASSGTAGYVRRTVSSLDTSSGGSVGAANPAVQRLLDRIVQQQLWQEASGAAYTSTRAEALSRLDQLYGTPGSASALDAVYNGFTSALQALANDPSSYSARTGVIDAANLLAQRLNGLSNGVQALRQQAEAGIGTAVGRVNELLSSLTGVNARIVTGGATAATADLKDQRDRILAELSQYVDIRTTENATGGISIVTPSGMQLFDGQPTVTFSFDERSALGPTSQWSADPSRRGVGTIIARDLSGNVTDIIANRSFRSGEIAALVELRDNTLVQAQSQLDELAGQLAGALSDREIAGSAAASGAASGFSVDISGLQPGNAVTLDYRVTPGGTTRRFSFVRVDSASSLPLPASARGDAANTVVGIDFSAGPAAVAAQIQAALGPGFSVSASGGSLQILDDGAGGTRDVVALTARPTSTGMTGSAELPLFVDAGRGNAAYTGSYEGGAQANGFAGRIALNPGLVADRSKLVLIDGSSQQGDSTRPRLLLERLTQSQRSLTNATGLDGGSATTTSTVSGLVQRVVSAQAQASAGAARLDEGQQVALAAVQSRFEQASQVNVDQEMASLIELQAAYSANARVISSVKEMLDLLLRL